MLMILYGLTAAAFAFVVFTLVMGAVAMGGKNEKSREMSNIWMRRRVAGQFIAIGLLILTVYVKKNGA